MTWHAVQHTKQDLPRVRASSTRRDRERRLLCNPHSLMKHHPRTFRRRAFTCQPIIRINPSERESSVTDKQDSVCQCHSQ
jgi:hypothetical protein